MDEFEIATNLFGRAHVQRYLDQTKGDRKLAIALYRWNSSMGAALWPEIEALEISLRNAISKHMFPNGFIDGSQIKALTTGKFLIPDNANHVSDQTFGFWVYLLASENQNTIWNRGLHRSFKTKTSRRLLHRDLKIIQNLRNKIGHHEAIFSQDFQQVHRSLANVFSAIAEDAVAWVIPLEATRITVLKSNPLYN
jgi:hypothetical protein